jgi:hypothetical protein
MEVIDALRVDVTQMHMGERFVSNMNSVWLVMRKFLISPLMLLVCFNSRRLYLLPMAVLRL